MQHHHIWMNIYLAVTEMKTPNKAMTFHLIRLDIPTARLRELLECKAGSGTPLNLMMQKRQETESKQPFFFTVMQTQQFGVYLQNNREVDKCVNVLVKENEHLESKHTVTQLCCDALFGETVKVKLDRFIFVAKLISTC